MLACFQAIVHRTFPLLGPSEGLVATERHIADALLWNFAATTAFDVAEVVLAHGVASKSIALPEGPEHWSASLTRAALAILSSTLLH
jgi:hypothetical protein